MDQTKWVINKVCIVIRNVQKVIAVSEYYLGSMNVFQASFVKSQVPMRLCAFAYEANAVVQFGEATWISARHHGALQIQPTGLMPVTSFCTYDSILWCKVLSLWLQKETWRFWTSLLWLWNHLYSSRAGIVSILEELTCYDVWFCSCCPLMCQCSLLAPSSSTLAHFFFLFCMQANTNQTCHEHILLWERNVRLAVG